MSDFNISTLTIKMAADVAQLSRDMGSAKQVVNSAMETIKHDVEMAKGALEAFGVALAAERIAEFVSRAIDAAAALEKLSQRTGMATETLSQLQYAAKLAEVPADTLNTAIKKLSVSIEQGAAGDRVRIAVFKQLGISQADLGQGTQAVMLKMADAYAHAQDGSGKAAVSIRLMGKAGDEMIPFLNQGAAGIRTLMTEADRLGLTIGGDFGESAAQFKENLTRIDSLSGKLAIMLAHDLVDGTSRAMQAFIDAAKEGDKFAGVLAAIKVLIGQDDLTQNQKKMVETTNSILNLQNTIDKIRAKGEENWTASDAAIIRSSKAKLATLQQEYGAAKQYVDAQDAQVEAAKKAAAAAQKAREEGQKLADANRQAQAMAAQEEAEYRAIAKALDAVQATTAKELEQGRALTEQEKLDIKVMEQVRAAKVPLTQAHLDAVAAALKETQAILDRKAAAAAEQQDATNDAKQWAKDQADLAAADKARADERDRVNKSIADQAQVLADSNDMLKLEGTLVGATNEQRAIGIGDLQVELTLKRQIQDITRDLSLDEAARARAIAAATANAEEAKAQVAEKAALQEQITLLGQMEQAGKQMWDALWTGGNQTFQKLGQALKTYLLDVLYQMTAKKWILSIGTSMTGGAASAGGSLLSSSAGSMFGSGLSSIGSEVMNGTLLGNIGAGMSGVGGSFASSVGAGLATDAMGATVAEGTAAATLGAGSTIGAALAAVPVYGWIALGAMALMSFMSKGGGPKVDGKYGTTYSGVASGALDPTVTSGAQSGIQSLQAQYNTLAQQLGGTANVDFGMGISRDPQGTAPTMLEIAGTQNGHALFSNTNLNVGRSDQELQTAVTSGLTDALITALKASNLEKPFADYLGTITSDMSVDVKTAMIKTLSDVASYTSAIGGLGGVFSRITDLSVQARGAMLGAAGGLQALTTATATYYQNFYTADEQRANTIAGISKALDSVGLSLSGIDLSSATARQQFRALVDSIDVSTDAGQKQFAVLMSVAGAFANVTASLDAVNNTLDTTTQTVTTVTSAVDALNAAIAASRTATDAAMQSLLASIAAQKQQVQSQISSTQQTIATLQGLFDYLGQQTQQLYGDVASTSAQQAGQGQDFITEALSTLQKTGVLPDQQKLASAVTAITTNMSQQTYATQADADFARLVLAGKLSTLKDAAGLQLDTAHQQLLAEQNQLTELDRLTTQAQAQIDALRGIDTSVKSVTTAIDNLARALLSEASTSGASLTGGLTEQNVNTAIGQVWQSTGGAMAVKTSTGLQIVGVTGDMFSGAEAQAWVNQQLAAGDPMAVYQKAKQEGISANSLDQLMQWTPGTSNAWAASAGVPSFAVGTNLVPHDMLAMVHKNEAIVPAPYNPAAGGTSTSDRHLKAMSERLDTIAANSKSQGQSLRVLEDAFSGRQKVALLVDQI
jgi:DNA-binding Xre family transcriptional regulator